MTTQDQFECLGIHADQALMILHIPGDSFRHEICMCKEDVVANISKFGPSAGLEKALELLSAGS